MRYPIRDPRVKFDLLTSEGYLTEEAKDYMRKVKVRSLDQLFAYLTATGDFHNVDGNPSDRNDVRISGHIATQVNGL